MNSSYLNYHVHLERLDDLHREAAAMRTARHFDAVRHETPLRRLTIGRAGVRRRARYAQR